MTYPFFSVGNVSRRAYLCDRATFWALQGEHACGRLLRAGNVFRFRSLHCRRHRVKKMKKKRDSKTNHPRVPPEHAHSIHFTYLERPNPIFPFSLHFTLRKSLSVGTNRRDEVFHHGVNGENISLCLFYSLSLLSPCFRAKTGCFFRKKRVRVKKVT